jgi:anti-sigma B factor antagonist
VSQTVRNLLDNNTDKILIDLYGVGYIDSAGLGELFRTYSSVRNGGGPVRVVNPSKAIRAFTSQDVTIAFEHINRSMPTNI